MVNGFCFRCAKGIKKYRNSQNGNILKQTVLNKTPNTKC